MNNFIKNVLLFVGALILSYFTAGYLGSVYNYLFPVELNSGWIGSPNSLEFIRGISLSLIFFLTFISATWVFKKTISTIWLVSPLIIYEVLVDIRHIYIPTILILVALGVSWVLPKIVNFKSAKTSLLN